VKDRPARHRLEYGIYLLLEGLLRALPHRATRRVGRALGSLAHALDRRHREIARRNLEMALPEIAPRERRRLARECFRHFGAALCETVSAARFDAVDVCRHLTLEGWEHLEAADRLGRGTFVLSAHFGYWEIVPAPVALYRGPMDIVFRPPDNPFLDRELRAARQRFGNRVLPKRGAARRMLEVLRKGGRVGILIDQRVQPREGIAVPFFGRPAWTSPVLARLSLRTGAPVVPVSCLPEPGGRYRLVARPPILPLEGVEREREDEAVAELTRRYLEAAEEDIRRHPQMWLWMHRRWETSR
jgi:Kdo2-lipid IVA lauroyltransferase/acyltransferase